MVINKNIFQEPEFLLVLAYYLMHIKYLFIVRGYWFITSSIPGGRFIFSPFLTSISSAPPRWFLSFPVSIYAPLL